MLSKKEKYEKKKMKKIIIFHSNSQKSILKEKKKKMNVVPPIFNHSPYLDMRIDAIDALKEKNGSSKRDILQGNNNFHKRAIARSKVPMSDYATSKCPQRFFSSKMWLWASS
ncbi:hypothetical protein J1N35_034164 [Gossypium stocksii]|uniref:Uncharacterized protein n=1 Tax=Gossypium stocksii TaxID=47602 RepID=A0A9D3USD6_9ROSI|nr:hypothetical protein J1N35_034164 [Gossypium stocksii]